MMRFLSLIAIASLLGSCTLSVEPERVDLLLPLYPLKHELVLGDGEPLYVHGATDHGLNFLPVSVAKDLHSPTGYFIPRDLEEAAGELQIMLPADFYRRLLLGYEEFAVTVDIADDPSVADRIIDLALFLHDTWNLYDESNPLTQALDRSYLYPVMRLFQILDVAKATA